MNSSATKETVVITKSGEQMVVSTPYGVAASVVISNDPIVKEVELDPAVVDIEKIKKQAMTNDVPSDILNVKTTE